MTGLAHVLQRFRSYLERDERRRWYCYAARAYSETLLVKHKRSKFRYLFKVWETRLPVGAARIVDAIGRYSRYKRQDVQRFAFLTHRFRVNAYDLLKSSALLELSEYATHHFALGLFSFEPHSRRMMYDCPERDPLFSMFLKFLKGDGFVVKHRIPAQLREDDVVRLYVDSDVLLDYLRKGPASKLLLRRARREDVQLVTSNLALQNLLLISKKTRTPTPLQIKRLLQESDFAVVESPRVDEIVEMLETTSPQLKRQHPSDVLSLLTATQVGCDFFLTYDQDLLSHRRLLGLKIRDPSEALRSLG